MTSNNKGSLSVRVLPRDRPCDRPMALIISASDSSFKKYIQITAVQKTCLLVILVSVISIREKTVDIKFLSRFVKK